MPKKQLGRKINANGQIEDLGFTVTQEEIAEWNEKVGYGEGLDVSGNIDPLANYYTKPQTDTKISESEARTDVKIANSALGVTYIGDIFASHYFTQSGTRTSSTISTAMMEKINKSTMLAVRINGQWVVVPKGSSTRFNIITGIGTPYNVSFLTGIMAYSVDTTNRKINLTFSYVSGASQGFGVNFDDTDGSGKIRVANMTTEVEFYPTYVF